MKKQLAIFGALAILSSCGVVQKTSTETKDQNLSTTFPTAAAENSQPTKASDQANPTVSPRKIGEKVGFVASCADLQFIEKPERDLILNCLDGKQGFNVGAIKGPAIVNIWGSWCPPCVGEIPIFVDFYASMDPSIQLIGIDFKDGPLFAVKPYIISAGITWPNFVDSEGAVIPISGNSVPVTWFINSSNQIVYKKFGPVASLNELRSLSKKYLGVS